MKKNKTNEKSSKDVLLKGINHSLSKFLFDKNLNWQKSFTFIQMADTQLRLTEDFKTKNDKIWDIELDYTRKCIEFINNLDALPEFVIVCGDMINSFSGKVNRKGQITDFMKAFLFSI